MNQKKKTNQPTLHAIAHGHIDPVWLWRWQEGYEEVRATFRSALDRMNEIPDLRFVCSSTAFYKWILETDPGMFEEIRARVEEGRWNIVGGWIVEPDCNVPNGESFVRQGLYGQRFVREHFGFLVRHAFNPDSFGHAGTLPQILEKSGFETYTYMRPAPDTEMEYENTTFRWKSRDGSQVLASCIPICYDAPVDHIDQRVEDLSREKSLLPGQEHVMMFFGLGNHGGGPTKACIAKVKKHQENPDAPPIVFSDLRSYYKALRESIDPSVLPVVETDLQHHARGCYTTHSEVKRLNRRAEHALMRTERWAFVAARYLGLPFPRAMLQEAWETVLFQQFHDILAGTSIQGAYEDTRDAYGSALWTAELHSNRVLQRLAAQVRTAGEGRAVLVFNPLPWPVQSVVEVPETVKRELGDRVRIVDDSGQDVPQQPIDGNRVEAVALAFSAEVPGLGYRTYRAVADETPEPSRITERQDEAHTFENDFWRLNLDPHTGEIVNLFDKKAGVEVLRRGLSLQVLVDQTDTWGHDLDGWRVEDGRFRAESISVHEQSPCRTVLRIESAFGNSNARILLTLYPNSPHIDLEIRVQWNEKHRVLKLAFDTAIEDSAATFDAPYGCIERPKSGHEEPGQAWVDLTGDARDSEGRDVPYGFAILNDCKYGYDLRDGCARLTLLRSPVYAHHDHARVQADAAYAYIDQGEQTIRVRLIPHAGPWQEAQIPRRAWEWNDPLWVHQESSHDGELPPALSFAECDSEHFLPTVLKLAEDDDSVVLRGYETDGQAGSVDVRLLGIDDPVSFGVTPHEIKTVRLQPEGDSLRARTVDLLEDETG